MELIKDSPPQRSAAHKAVEMFVNSSIGSLPGSSGQESTFFVQKAYDYASNMIKQVKSGLLSSFHYTKGHLKDDTTRDNEMESRNSMYSDFLKTNRSNFLMKSARICQNPEDKEKRRSSFNSVYELTKNGQDAWTSNDWNKNHYRFDVPDRKQEYYALENFTNDLINTKARNHQYRNPKPERPIVNQSFDLNKKPHQLEPVKVSLLDDPNYVNKEKYKFPPAQAQRSKSDNKAQTQQQEQAGKQWLKYYKKNRMMIEQPKTSALHKPYGQREEEAAEEKLQLYHRNLKSDAYERQLDLGKDSSSKIYCKTKERPHSTRFFNYQRGVFDILYPRRILH